MTHHRAVPLFLKLASCAEADRVLERFAPPGGLEEVPLEGALGRVIARPFTATEPMPAWPRARMDGFAVRAADTHGASDALPAYLKVAATVAMGEDASRLPRLTEGECAAISTGGMMMPGADAVLMVELTAPAGEGQIEARRPVGEGEHVQLIGEDLKPGTLLLEQGTLIGAPEVAALAMAGVDPVSVHRRPRVVIFSTGDELVDHKRVPPPGRVRDSNSLAMAAQVRSAGGDPVIGNRISDEAEDLRRGVTSALDEGADIVLVSGGSSVGTRDVTAEVLGGLEGDGILLHGINIRPGKPTIIADGGGRPCLGMPGYPVSSMVVFHRFVRPLIWRLAGRRPPPELWPIRRTAQLAAAIHSRGGREDYVRVTLEDSGDGELPEATPLLGGSAALTSLLHADGVVVLEAGCEGLPAGTQVEVLGL